jgi:glycosyltransferase involved in cell wall biosynthesis
MYYPIEKICSYFVDDIITINQEDYHFAKKHLQDPRVFYLPGIGVDVDRFSKAPDCAIDLHNLFHLSKNEKVMISVGEMTANKNHRIIIKALTHSQLGNVHYMIVGSGVCRPRLEEYAARLNVSDRVHFLGYRNDIDSLLHASDVFVFPSYREGLPVALMEAMASGVPIVASRIRGNVDLIEDGVNGFLCDPQDVDGFADKIRTLLDEPNLAETFRNNGLEKIKNYDKRIVAEQLREIYFEMDARVSTAAEKV